MTKRSEEAYNRWVEEKQSDAKQPFTKFSRLHSAASWISRRWEDQRTFRLAVFVLVVVVVAAFLWQKVNSCRVELGEQRNISVSLSRSLEAERADLDRKKKEAADLKSKAQQLRKDYDSKKNETKENAKLRENYESMKKEVAELKKQLKEKKEAADLESKKTCTLF